MAWIAAVQHGVVDLEQLQSAGVAPGAVRRRVAAGRLHQCHRGVYAVGHPGLTERGRWMAAILAGGPTAVLSHRSAAAFWELLPDARHPVITVPGVARRARSGLIVHAGALGARDVVVVDGLRLTTVPRTLLDVAAGASVRLVVQAIDRATARRLIDSDAARATLAGATGRRGAGILRRALLITRPQDVLTRSELERRALRLLRRTRLPAPEVNADLLSYEIDLLWREARLAVELDGRETHDTAAAFERDRRRDAELVARGWRVMRFTWRQVVNDPRWVASRLAAAHASRRRG